MSKLNFQEIKTSFLRDGFVKVDGIFDYLLVDKLLNILDESENLKTGECVFFHSKTIHYTNQLEKPSCGRSSVAIRIGGFSAKYSKKRQEIYAKNIKYNRDNTIKEGLTGNFSKAQHNS